MCVIQELEPTSAARERVLPRHTGSFEISCRLPPGKVLFLHPISAGPREGSRAPPSCAARGARAASRAKKGSEAVNHGRPPARSSPRNLGRLRIANRAGGRHLRPGPGSRGPKFAVWSAGRRRPGWPSRPREPSR